MGLFNILSWLYISWLCDVVCRWLFRTIKAQWTKPIENDPDAEYNKMDTVDVRKSIWDSFSLNPSEEVREPKNEPKEELQSTTKARAHSLDNFWIDDSAIKEGLARLDRRLNFERQKEATSNFDRNEKLSYQKQKPCAAPPQPKVSALGGFDFKGENPNPNPLFYMKPNNYSGSKINGTDEPKIEDDLDKSFKDMCDNIGKGISSVAKTVDTHIDKTFNEIYDKVLPSLF